jgi:hypothetical protein
MVPMAFALGPESSIRSIETKAAPAGKPGPLLNVEIAEDPCHRANGNSDVRQKAHHLSVKRFPLGCGIPMDSWPGGGRLHDTLAY